MTNTLNTSGTAVANAAGTATLSLGPARFAEHWDLDYVSVSTTSLLATRCDVYLNNVSPSSYMESTRSGNGDTSDTVHHLEAPDKLVFVFAGSTPGAICTVFVRGKMKR